MPLYGVLDSQNDSFTSFLFLFFNLFLIEGKLLYNIVLVSAIHQHESAISSVQFSRSVMSDSLRPHESQHASLPVHHHLPEFTQTHVHQVGDTIQPSHPLSSPFPPAPNPSQHQSLFQ